MTRKIVVLWLRGILPPCIDAQWHKPAVHLLPIGMGGLGIEEVHPVGAGNIVTTVGHLPSYL